MNVSYFLCMLLGDVLQILTVVWHVIAFFLCQVDGKHGAYLCIE
jgi:hypothetical protein